MSASGYTPILIYGSTTASNVPLAANLTTSSSGVELAINAADGKLFYKDSGGTVQVLAGKGGAGVVAGSNTQVQYNNNGVFGASSNLTFNGTTLTANTLNLTNALGTAYGGTGLTSFTANGVLYASSTSALTTGSALTFDGTNLTVGTSASYGRVTIGNGGSANAANALALNGTDNAANGSFIQGLRNGSAAWLIGDTASALGSGTGFISYNYGTAPWIWQLQTGGEQMRLTSTGLGIGTSSPNQKLSVNSANPTNGYVASLSNTQGTTGRTGTYLLFDATSLADWKIGIAPDVNAFSFYDVVAGAERMRLDSSGNLGVGTTSPTSRIDARLAASGSGAVFTAGNVNNGQFGGLGITDGGVYPLELWGNTLVFKTGASTYGSTTEKMRLDATGNLGIGTSSPQYKLDVTSNIAINGVGGNGYGLIGYAGATPSTGFRFSLTRQDAISAGSVYLNSYGAIGFGVAKGATGTPSDAPNMLLDSSGNLGLGVTPSAWGSVTAAQVKTGSMWSVNNRTYIGANYYYNSVGNRIYINADYATEYAQLNGTHSWGIAASGAAGGTVSLTQAMTLDSGGRLVIGATSAVSGFDLTLGGVGTQILSPSTNTAAAFTRYNNLSAQLFVGVENSAGTGFGLPAYSNFIYGVGANPLIFLTNSNERMRLDATGNLGVSCTPANWGGNGTIALPNSGALAFQGTYGNVGANYYYNSGFKYTTTAAATLYSQGAGAHVWYNAPSGTAGAAISFTQAMTLDASGNLGVGTTSPTSTIHANGTIQARIGATGIQIYGDGGSGYVNSVGSYPLIFQVNSTERARIDANGVLIVGGTTAAGYEKFCAVINDANTPPASFWNQATSGNNYFTGFYTEGTATVRGSINYNRAGGLVVYNTTSDYRAKDIFGPVTDSGAVIDSVPVYMGKMHGATQERPMFIAHETPTYAHMGEKDAVDADGNPVYQQMDASALIPVMWAEIQSLRQRLAAAGL